MFQPILPIDLEPLTEANILPRLIAAIGSELGEYEPGLPACYLIKNSDKDPPKNYRTEGLECLIFYPDPQSSQTLHHNAALTEFWEIRLIQRDRTRSCLVAYKNILANYPDCYLNSHIQPNRDIDEQLNISISQVGVIK